MPNLFLTDLLDVLKKAGVNAVGVNGWERRSYPGWSAGYDRKPTHVMIHHTASNTTPANDLAYILKGAPNTPGRPNIAPIGNLFLDRTGTFHVVAAGRACTNGKGSSWSWRGGVPDDQMNSYSIAIEAANSGVGEPWPKVQTDAYVKGVAALCLHYGILAEHVRAHHEWAPGRKIDPAGPSPWATGKVSWNMAAFRRDVAAAMAAATQPPATQPPATQPPAAAPSTPRLLHAQLVKVQNNDAMLVVSGLTAVWAQDTDVLNALTFAGILPNGLAKTVPVDMLRVLELVGPMPPGMTASMFALHRG